jgi:predicted metal-dependent HD superfamily phosphohydrolase
MDDRLYNALHDRWESLCARVSAFENTEHSEMTFDMVRAMYDHPPRAYHNLEHIQDCLTTFDNVTVLADEPDVIEMALWLHDSIFFPERPDNEARSADATQMIAGLLGCPPEFVHRVRELVMVTRHDSCPMPGDGALISDVDLSILGRPPERYGAYASAIREEFAFADEESFRAGRIAFIERTLDRPSIYVTAYIRQHLERQARENLERELDELLGEE